MRLIDADKLKYAHYVQRSDTPIGYEGTQPIYEYASYIDYAVSNAPTVDAIPIDKPFLKMRYGDYVVYNKKWLVNHLQTEWNILQGKEYQPAIPVEWILKWACEFIDPNSEGYKMAMELVHDWRKENEHKESD